MDAPKTATIRSSRDTGTGKNGIYPGVFIAVDHGLLGFMEREHQLLHLGLGLPPVRIGLKPGIVSGLKGIELVRTCSGRVVRIHQMGGKVGWCDCGQTDRITAKDVTEAAAAGDPVATEIVELSARYLGRGLSVIIDILNPELIVIGGIFARRENLFRPQMEETVRREALSPARDVCRIVPAQLGESIGDYAALSVACT